MTTALTLRSVCASYGSTAVVRNVSFDLARGETLSLLGPSGCGKTTLLRTIAGLHPIGAGSISLNDSIIADDKSNSVAPEKRRIGMVFQDGALFPHLSIAKNVAYGLRSHPDAKSRVSEVLDLVGLNDYRDRLPGTLSGGQQQRVALARALAPAPKVLLLDEPFSALDAGLRVQLRRQVRRILSDIGITVVLVTHDQEEAFVLGDKVAVMNQGEIIQLDTPAGLYTSPDSAWVAGFVGEANVLQGTVQNRQILTDIGAVPLPESFSSAQNDQLLHTLVRPEQLRLQAGGQSTIVAIEYYGHDTRYEVALHNGHVLGIRTTGDSFAVGDQVEVCFRHSDVMVWDSADSPA